MKQKLIFKILFLLSLIPTALWSQAHSDAQFILNKGQWNKKVLYKLPLNSGDIYFEGVTTTFCLYDKTLYGKAKHGNYTDSLINGHTYKTHFVGANPKFKSVKRKTHPNYYNFYLGNDSSTWKTNVPAQEDLLLREIYNGIDYHFYEYYGQPKYDFIVSPEGNPYDILIAYEGIEKIKLQRGHLVLETNIGQVLEQSPYAYQFIDGEKRKVECHYILKNNLLSFEFPEGYDPSLELIIDPVLTFGTYTGSSASNFGCTATNDLAGNMYVGGTVFGTGYPTTTGAFQVTFGGGVIDMAISKFSADGSSLLYSTYLGGTNSEIPHSLVVTDADELIILGTTGSTNYPVSAGCFQNSMNGGTATGFGGYGFNYSGCDIVVTKFSAGGNNLLGSTYLGGSGNDGLIEGSLLHFNYGDAFRGEVINGLGGEIIIASTTESADFPVTANATQSNLQGPSDALLVKLNSDLSNVTYASYLGGSDFDCGNSVQINSLGEIYVAGGTISTDFPNTAGGLNTSYLGGNADGFIASYNSSGSIFQSASYIGTSEYDQNYFIQCDTDDEVYIIGQTEGNYPILNAGYSNPNSGQYIQKLSTDLSTSLMSTTIGSGSGEVDIAVNAFLVSECDFIYISGWGGPLNGNTGLGAHAGSSSTSNLPITGDAFQTTTDGSDFYLAVLAPDAAALLYATYFGGASSAEHADGGTSRFDKNGNVYQAVCAGCGGNSDFPTTAGAWSNTNNSSNCNLGAFKFDLGSITPALSVPQPYVCLPSSYQFLNNSSGGNQYFWDFGDGNTSTDFEPSHLYTDTGHYQVSLIVADSLNCLVTDTAYLDIDVFALNNATVDIVDTICRGDSVLLTASGGVTYQWTPGLFLSNPSGYETYAFPPITETFMVIATDSCGMDTALITVPVFNDSYSTMPDTTICSGYQVTLEAYGGTNYHWIPDPTMQNPNSATPTVSPTNTTTYYVEITTNSGCIYVDSILVTTVNNFPTPSLNNDTTICSGDQITLEANGGSSYLWSPTQLLNNINQGTAQTNITSTSEIFVEISNACGSTIDSVTVEVISVNPEIISHQIICPGESVQLWASGGTNYIWSPTSSIIDNQNDTILVSPSEPTFYNVIVENNEGCQSNESTFVDLHPMPQANIQGNTYISFGQETTLQGITNAQSFYWSSADSSFCQDCASIIVAPESSSTYQFIVTDNNGCTNIDSITVQIDPSIYVPNSFTPNGDGVNDQFIVLAKEIHDYQLYIFNRWGQLIFESDDLNTHWNGQHKDKGVLIDTYIWKINYLDNLNESHELIGHVNVIR